METDTDIPDTEIIHYGLPDKMSGIQILKLSDGTIHAHSWTCDPATAEKYIELLKNDVGEPISMLIDANSAVGAAKGIGFIEDPD